MELKGLGSDGFSRNKANQFSQFLQALSDANEYSLDLSVSPWDFALWFAQLEAFDLNQNDLRWMIRKGWIAHRNSSHESLPESRLTREMGEASQFIISNQGLVAIRDFIERNPLLLADDPTNPVSQLNERTSSADVVVSNKPSWDMERRQLTFRGKVVKRFRWPAPNQETILSVFSEEGWPLKIADPLSQEKGLDPKRRLGDTIKCLNRNQFSRLIRFRGDGTGEGVLWERLSEL